MTAKLTTAGAKFGPGVILDGSPNSNSKGIEAYPEAIGEGVCRESGFKDHTYLEYTKSPGIWVALFNDGLLSFLH